MDISTETRKSYAFLSWSIFRRLKDANIKRNGTQLEYGKALKFIGPEEVKDMELRAMVEQAIMDWVRVGVGE